MKHLFLAMATITLAMHAYAQKKDSTFFFHTDLTVTNNGFSIVPAFTLGDPAVYLDMKMGKKRLTFEPQFRFALEGRPWSFVFIYRYKAVMKKKFSLSFGTHLPGLNFVKTEVAIGGIQEPLSVARRFLAGEIIPTYKPTDRFTIGMYYLRGHAFQEHGPQNSNFLALQGSISKIKIGGPVFINFNPQVFYLKVDDNDGYYVNATTTLGFQNFPFTISNTLNKAITTTIPAREFDWNIGLVYTLDAKFVQSPRTH